MTSLAGLSLDNLTQRCVDETEKFNRHQPNDPQFCFELLRRALAEGISEAFTRVYQVYERQVLRWVYSHSRFEQTGESAD
ncbi:MAG TPA: sigma-70 family RNA polymerase sigma factor, partial [Roseiflexaceae bacterium]